MAGECGVVCGWCGVWLVCYGVVCGSCAMVWCVAGVANVCVVAGVLWCGVWLVANVCVVACVCGWCGWCGWCG